MKVRTVIAGRVRRLRLPRRLIMLLLSLLVLVGPLYNVSSGTARAQEPPSAEICVQGPDGKGGTAAVGEPGRVVQDCNLRSAGMADLERQAIDDLLKMHQLPPTDSDEIVTWERNTVRAFLFAALIDMITKVPADRTATEQAIVNQMAEIVRGRRVAAVQYSIDRYNEWLVDPCAFVEPVATDYQRDDVFCSGNPNGTIWSGGPIPPSIESLLTYGQAHIYEEFKDGGPALGPGSEFATSLGLLVGVVAAGIAGTVGAVIGSSLTVSSALIAAIHPFLAAAVAGSSNAAAISAVAGASAGGVGGASVGAIFATVVIAVVIVVIRIIQVVAQEQIPVQLNEALTSAQAGVDLSQLLQTKEGKVELFAAFLVETLPNYGKPSTVPGIQDTDPTFVLTDAAGNKTRSRTLNYQCWSPLECRSDLNHTARLSDGWFVSQNGTSGAAHLTLGIDYIDWDGDAWTAWRVGPREFLHTRTRDDSTTNEPAEPFTSNEIKFKTWDGSLFTASINQPPPDPGAPLTNAGGAVNNGDFWLFWVASTDGEGDPVTYTLQRCDPDARVPGLEIPELGISTPPTNPSCATIASDLAHDTSLTPEFHLASEQEGKWTYRVQATDGYSTSAFSAESEAILVDRTPPTIIFESLEPAPNAHGWNNSDVTASWTCPLSFDPNASGPVSQHDSETVSTAGTNQSATGTCQDNAGNSSTNTVTGINIDKTAPVVNHGGPYTVNEGSSVQLDGGESSDALSGIAVLQWDLDGSGQNPIANPATVNGVDGPDSSTVYLLVLDKAGNPRAASTTVTVVNVAPTATFGAPAAVAEGSAISLTLTNPSDPSSVDTQAGFSYAFDCGDGTGYGAFSAAASANCPASDDGTRTVKGKIQDKDGGEAEYSATVTITNLAPTVSLGQDVELDEGDVFSDSGSFNDPGTNDGHSATVDYGDGAGDQSLTPGAGGNFTLNHTYADDGQYIVEVCVIDDGQGSDCDDVQVTVNNVAPTITDVSVEVGHSGALVTVEATDPAGVNDPLSYAFDCDNDGEYEMDAGETNNATCALNPLQEGSFPIDVQVRDDDGGVTINTATAIVSTELCANNYTGELRYAANCRGHETALTLPDVGPVAVCASRHNGMLRLPPNGMCARHETSYVLPEDGPLSVCISSYTQVMRTVNDIVQCTTHEFGRVIAATEIGETTPPRSR